MTEAQCDELERLLKKHRWPSFCRRLNIVPPEFRSEATWGYGRLCLRRTKSQAFGADNKKMRPLYDHIVSMLPEDFPRMEHLCMTINHNVTCYPHRDRANIGDVLIMFLGDFEGGELHMEDGTVYSEKRVWHRYDGAGVTHWNTEHVGEKYSVIVHNNNRPLKWKTKKE